MLKIIEVEGGFKVIVTGAEESMNGPTFKTLARAEEVYAMARKAAADFMTGRREMPSIYAGE